MTDMEVVSGIVVQVQVAGGKPLHEECRKLHTEEIIGALCGHHQWPVLLVTVAGKRGLSRFSARNKPALPRGS